MTEEWVRPKEHDIQNSLTWYFVGIIVLIMHFALYRPWTLKPPRNVLLPTVHITLLTCTSWAIATVSTMHKVNGAHQAWALFFHAVNMIIGVGHTYYFFPMKQFGKALKVAYVNFVFILATTYFLYIITPATGYAYGALAAWWVIVIFLNQKAAAAEARKAAEGGSNKGSKKQKE